MINKIGYINSIDLEGFKNELKSLNQSQRQDLYGKDKLWKLGNINITDDLKMHNLSDVLLPSNYYKSSEECFDYSVDILNKIEKSINHKKLFNERLEVCWKNEEFVAFLYGKNVGAIIPIKYVTIEYSKDYSTKESMKINELLGNGEINSVTIRGDNTLIDLNNSLKSSEEKLVEVQKKAEEELNLFREKVAEQERALRQKQEELLSHYQNIVEMFKDQIYQLELNIFALRSKLGETFSISHIRKGKNADDNIPVVVYQKFRYMDEELTKASINSDNFSIQGCHLIDLFDKYYDDVIDLFCPVDKCITFFKTSKSGKIYVHNPEEDIIQELEYYHGNQLGIVIRNGENIYLIFIDQEVMLQDNLFISNNTKETPVNLDNVKSIRDKKLRPMINRKLLFVVLEAVIENTNIFGNLKFSGLKSNKRIIFSDADGLVSYSKYPTFTECFNNKDVELKEGDDIFIEDRHNGSTTSRDSWGYGTHEEHRSRGYANRGRDAIIESGIAKLNIIEHYRTGYFKQIEGESCFGNYFREINKEEYEQLLKENKVVDKREYFNYYVSCKRDIEEWQRPKDRWGYNITSRINNVNLQIYRDEFMSIMWINSNYVESWINRKDCIGGKDFVYFAKNLKQLKDFLVNRETVEFSIINKFIKFDMTPDNIDILLKWKKENKIRNFTEFQAKRFTKHLTNSI